MTAINIIISGASRGASLLWDACGQPLQKTPDGYAARIEAGGGVHVYAITVCGAPGEKWTARVEGGVEPFEHRGHMSPGGMDTTNDTPYEVS